MTPVIIEVLMHCYYRTEPFELTKSIEHALEFLIKNQLIMISEQAPGYCCTEKGKKYVEMLLATPFPFNASIWRDPREI